MRNLSEFPFSRLRFAAVALIASFFLGGCAGHSVRRADPSWKGPGGRAMVVPYLPGTLPQVRIADPGELKSLAALEGSERPEALLAGFLRASLQCAGDSALLRMDSALARSDALTDTTVEIFRHRGQTIGDLVTLKTLKHALAERGEPAATSLTVTEIHVDSMQSEWVNSATGGGVRSYLPVRVSYAVQDLEAGSMPVYGQAEVEFVRDYPTTSLDRWRDGFAKLGREIAESAMLPAPPATAPAPKAPIGAVPMHGQPASDQTKAQETSQRWRTHNKVCLEAHFKALRKPEAANPAGGIPPRHLQDRAR